MSSNNIESVLSEERVFEPTAEFSANAHVKSIEEYEAIHKRSIEDPDGYWAEQAGNLTWQKPWDTVLDW